MYPIDHKSRLIDGRGEQIAKRIRILDDLGVDIPAGARDALTEYDRCHAYIQQVRNERDARAVYNDVSARLARGEATRAEVLSTAQLNMNVVSPGGPFLKITDNAERIASSAFGEAMAEHGDEIYANIAKAVDARVQILVDIAQYAPDEIDIERGGNSLEYMFANRPDASDAWSALQELYKVARILRRYRISTSRNRRDDFYEFQGDDVYLERRKAGWRGYTNLRDSLIDGNITTWIYAYKKGLKPGLYAESELVNVD